MAHHTTVAPVSAGLVQPGWWVRDDDGTWREVWMAVDSELPGPPVRRRHRLYLTGRPEALIVDAGDDVFAHPPAGSDGAS